MIDHSQEGNLCVSVDSLGIVLTRGYGQYIFIGNVSVEEGISLNFLFSLHHVFLFYSVLIN